MRLILFILLFDVFAHGGKKHDVAGDIKKEALDQINAVYIESIKPLFERSCFDCHSQNTQYPFYYKIPGVRHLIDRDIREALKHFDMTDGFPFKSHETPYSDLKAIREEIEENEMPPFRYRMMHWNSRLTDKEKQLILMWVNEGIRKMEASR